MRFECSADTTDSQKPLSKMCFVPPLSPKSCTVPGRAFARRTIEIDLMHFFDALNDIVYILYVLTTSRRSQTCMLKLIADYLNPPLPPFPFPSPSHALSRPSHFPFPFPSSIPFLSLPYPRLPVPSHPLPFPIPFPPLPCREAAPLNPARGSGERCKKPKSNLVHFSLKI